MKRLVAVTLATVLAPAAISAAEKLSIAAAANLVFVLEALHAEFAKTAPAVQLEVVTGASGGLVSQIVHGAPFDVFLSADMDFPRRLVDAGQAEAGSLTTVAIGRLVLWTTNPEVELKNIVGVVRAPSVRRLAIANVETAPFGRAARETLTKLGAWADAQPKLVVGENVAQAAQYVETGNADAGFVAMSLVVSSRLREKGRWLEVPADLYAPLDHGVVITKRGASNAAALRYVAFLRSPEARAIFERSGYHAP